MIIKGNQRPAQPTRPARAARVAKESISPASVQLAKGIAALDNLYEMATSTGKHQGHTLKQSGRCVYCSCGGRYQGTIPRPKGNAAQAAAIEKSLAKYFELSCGHYGTRETDEMMRDWRTKRLEHFCETCNSWKLSKQNFTKGNELPQDPLF